MDGLAADILARRGLFPRGLAQPASGFRFGADTLLLSAFAAAGLPRAKTRTRAPCRGLDLGTGSGAASLGLLLLRPDLDLALTGIDTGPEMVEAAEQNARNLGFAKRFQPLLADVADFRAPGCDFVLANPPFRRPGTGRSCPDAAKNRARFEGPDGLAAFAACAARCLKPQGRLFLVHLSERLPELLRVLEDQGLAPRSALPVQGHAGQNPRLVLLEARRSGRRSFALAAPLTLYGPDNALSPQAKAFCPPLAANPRQGGRQGDSALAKQPEAE